MEYSTIKVKFSLIVITLEINFRISAHSLAYRTSSRLYCSMTEKGCETLCVRLYTAGRPSPFENG